MDESLLFVCPSIVKSDYSTGLRPVCPSNARDDDPVWWERKIKI